MTQVTLIASPVQIALVTAVNIYTAAKGNVWAEVLTMAEYKCGDCIHAGVCEKAETLVGFSRDNPVYCAMFLNSADVEPVRHGRWVSNGILDSVLSKCSLCGIVYVSSSFNYCPNCGAKMDGGAE